MKRFSELFSDLDQTNKTNEKVALLKKYFAGAPEEDKIWALALFSGRRPPRLIKTAQIQQWAIEAAGIPEWLFRESYNSVGDLGETISLILPSSSGTNHVSLSGWFESFRQMMDANENEKKCFILEAWNNLSGFEVFVFNKLLMGSLRIGVSQTLVIRAIAEVSGTDPSVMAHRIMGNWDPYTTSFSELVFAENPRDEISRPYPFFLAYAVEGGVETLGDPAGWMAEWKWDGIRAQVIVRKGELFIWSRGEELVTGKFPELHVLKDLLPDGTVLDGEILCVHGKVPLPFNVLQTRIGRKNITRKILEEAPASFMMYDIMEHNGQDIRNLRQEERRDLLAQLFEERMSDTGLLLSPLVRFSSWDELKALHAIAREMSSEGFMIKLRKSPYLTGRKKGNWWKWKTDPYSVDAVLVYAQKGHGRRAELYTDYTFAVWNDDKLVPFAKAYSGLTDAEIREVDRFIKQNTLEKFGPVRTVKPELVFEIGFEGINISSRHKSGVAVRFPRILRQRPDKKKEEADTLESLKGLLTGPTGSGSPPM